ncbi:MAG: DoxX family protein [Ignavibacteriae bacterium]|nr:DoxX family protein [Ignavibacteriota bacterium]MCB9242997.1 DoxX family protein [Ignavibacteriales bacterium]
MKFTLLTGRILFSLIFLMTLMSHFSSQSIEYAAASGVPLANIAVPFSGIIAALGALSIMTGYKAKLGAWLVVLFLIPVTFTMHNFWTISDPMARQMQMVMFMKNISIMGGALIVSYFGSGPLSLGESIEEKKENFSSQTSKAQIAA